MMNNLSKISLQNTNMEVHLPEEFSRSLKEWTLQSNPFRNSLKSRYQPMKERTNV